MQLPTLLMDAPHTVERRKSRPRRAWDWIRIHTFQIYFTIMFAWQAFVSRPPYDVPIPMPDVWPWVFAVGAVAACLSIWRPMSNRLMAATGTTIATVALGRVVGLLQVFVSQGEHPSALVGAATWGVVVIVGLNWPRLAMVSGLRHVVREGRRADSPDG